MAFDVLTNRRNGIKERSSWFAVARFFIITLFCLIRASHFFDPYFRFLFATLPQPFFCWSRGNWRPLIEMARHAPARSRGNAAETRPQIMLELQKGRYHNIKFVTPEHGVSQILGALLSPYRWALNCRWCTVPATPRVSHSVDDGRVGIYLPDFKRRYEKLSAQYLKQKDSYISSGN